MSLAGAWRIGRLKDTFVFQGLVVEESPLYLLGAEYAYASLLIRIAPLIHVTVTFFLNRHPAE